MNRLKIIAAALSGALVASIFLVSTGIASRQAVTPRHEAIAAAKLLNLCDLILRFRQESLGSVTGPKGSLRSEWTLWKIACRSTDLDPGTRARFGG